MPDKWKIYDEIHDCGFKYKIVAAFDHMTRVDESWVQELIASGEDIEDLFAFTEAFETLDDLKQVPLGLRKMKRFGLINPIIEINLCTDIGNLGSAYTFEEKAEKVIHKSYTLTVSKENLDASVILSKFEITGTPIIFKGQIDDGL